MGWAARLGSKGPGVFIGIPTMGVLHQRLVGLLISLTQEHRNGLVIHMISHAIPVDFARNSLVEEFLRSPCEWLLMIDADVVPPPTVLNLTKHGADTHPIVGGVCLGLINGKVTSTIFQELKESPGQYVQHEHLNDSGVLPVDATGTGCLAIHRSVFERLSRPYFEFVFHEESRAIKTGEDIRFCEKARAAGFPVHIDKSVRCSHYKDVDLDWVNKEIVNYMSPEKVTALIDKTIAKRTAEMAERLRINGAATPIPLQEELVPAS